MKREETGERGRDHNNRWRQRSRAKEEQRKVRRRRPSNSAAEEGKWTKSSRIPLWFSNIDKSGFASVRKVTYGCMAARLFSQSNASIEKTPLLLTFA